MPWAQFVIVSESNTVIHNIINVYVHKGRIEFYVYLDLSIIGVVYRALASKWHLKKKKTDPKTNGLSWRDALNYLEIYSQGKFRVFSTNTIWLPVICLPVHFTQVRKDTKIAGGNHFSLAQLFKRWDICWVRPCVISRYQKDDSETHFLTSICSSTIIRPSPSNGLWQSMKLDWNKLLFWRSLCMCDVLRTL